MKKWTCPACHGYGGDREPILDDGSGPWFDCGYCKGTGMLTSKMFYKVLGYQSWWVRRLKKQGR